MINQEQNALFANGCFWCTEAIFKQLKGIISVLPGYAGGFLANPTYEQVSGGKTGHTECLKIEFNPKLLSYEKLLEVFFLTHDPTTLNKQGNDEGEQYRSAIFYYNDEQKQSTEKIILELEKKKIYSSPIITQILPYKNFFPAEDYHQNYYKNNPDAPYCQMVINPKIAKLREIFKNLLK